VAVALNLILPQEDVEEETESLAGDVVDREEREQEDEEGSVGYKKSAEANGGGLGRGVRMLRFRDWNLDDTTRCLGFGILYICSDYLR